MESKQIIHIPSAQKVLNYLDKYIPEKRQEVEAQMKVISRKLEMLTMLTFTPGTAPDEWENVSKHIHEDLNEVMNFIQNSYLVTNALPKNELYIVHRCLDEMRAYSNNFKPRKNE
ncbi:MAG: hypothetical protein V4565_08995 [Bacteroidota bacterium]